MGGKPELKLTPEQRLAVYDSQHELAVSAAAGSGKTTVLTERVIQRALGLDAEGSYHPGLELDLSRLLVVTFTNAAANTLRERLSRRLLLEIESCLTELGETAAPHEDLTARLHRLRRQLANLTRAQVSTLHSFCSDVVRRYGHANGVTLGRLLDEDEARRIQHDLATQLLDNALGVGADSALRHLALAWGGTDGLGPEDLERVAHESGLRRILLALYTFRSVLVDPVRWEEQHLKLPPLDPEHYDAAHPAVAGIDIELRSWLARVHATCRSEQAEVAAVLPTAVHLTYLECRLGLLQGLSADMDWDGLRALHAGLLAKQDGSAGRMQLKWKRAALSTDVSDLKKVAPELAASIRASCDQLLAESKQWESTLTDEWADVARRENAVTGWLNRLWALAAEFEQSYSSFKRQHGLADFSDLERLALSVLLAGTDEMGQPIPSETARELRGHYQAVLVDEYQDVNPLQHALINLVTADPPTGGESGRSLFAVGDLKQSIYAFRHADPSLFADLQHELRDNRWPGGAGQARHGRVYPLQANFRSRASIITAINHVFTGLMRAEFGGEEYGPETELKYGGLYEKLYAAFPAGYGEVPARLSIALREGAAAEPVVADDEVGEDSLDELAYRRVAQVLVEIRNEQVNGQPRMIAAGGKVEPLRWRDMVVLVRATSQIDPLRQALEQAEIPVYAPGTTGFYERPEIADALSVLAVLDDPRRDVPLAAVLRGPVGGLTPAELLAIARPMTLENWERQPLWERARWWLVEGGLQADIQAKLEHVLTLLDTWRTNAVYLPLPELLWRVYNDGGLLAAAAALAGGQQRVANLIELHNKALRFSEHGLTSLGRFMEHIRQSRAAATDAGEAPVLTEAQDVVQIMTVHRSKGLEFPVVVLPYLRKQFNFRSAQGDVLMHHRAGLAGLHFDLACGLGKATGPEEDPERPMRQRTLSYLGVKAAVERDLRAEELRLLYVAMSRARERLELVMPLETVTKTGQDGAAVRSLRGGEPTSAPEEARRPWDWIARQLAADIAPQLSAQGLSLEYAAVRPATSAWEVDVVPESDLGVPKHDQLAPLEEHNGEHLIDPAWGDVAKRLAWQYGAPGESALPAKLTVTRVTAQSTQEGDVLGYTLAGDDESTKSTAARHAAELGTLVHQLLARIDLSAELDEPLLRNALAELASEPGLAEQVPFSQLIAMGRDLMAAFDGFQDATLYSEVPLSMLVSPDNLPAGLWPSDAGGLWPDSQVLVQGAIDLLCVWNDRALVLDYKLSRSSAAVLSQRYGGQLAWYATAVRALLPTLVPEQVSWAIYGIGGAGLVRPS